MNSDHPKSLSHEELMELGIDPEHPFCSERITSYQIDVRCGDHRVRRSSNGSMTVSYGYYADAQTRSRQLMAEQFGKAVVAAMKDSPLAQFMGSP
jgi:hypothetical protein